MPDHSSIPSTAQPGVSNEMQRLLTIAREALTGGKAGKAERALDSLQEVFDRTEAVASRRVEVLWAVWVRGPDDVVAVASFEDAVRLADGLNWWALAQPMLVDDPCISAVPMLWDGLPERHAADLAKLGTKGHDYAIPTEEQVEKQRLKAMERRAAQPTPPVAGAVPGDWLPIKLADKSIVEIIRLPDVPEIHNSDRYWVRDEDGRVFKACWFETPGQRSYWWDLDGEYPVDPVAFMPHPLDRDRFLAAPPVTAGTEDSA